MPSTVPGGSAAGCTNGITSPTRSLPSALTAAAMARSLPTSCAVSTSTAATSRLSQYSSPEASAEVKSSRAMFVVVVDEDARGVEVAVADARRVELLDLAPDGGERVVGDRIGGDRAERASGRRGGHEHRRAGSADAGLLDPRRVHAGAIGEHQGVRRRVRPAGCRLPNTGMPGSWYIARCQALAMNCASRWSRPNASTRSFSPEVSTTSITDARGTPFSRSLQVGDVVSEVGQRRAHFVDRGPPGGRAERHQDRGARGDPEQAAHRARRTGIPRRGTSRRPPRTG